MAICRIGTGQVSKKQFNADISVIYAIRFLLFTSQSAGYRCIFGCSVVPCNESHLELNMYPLLFIWEYACLVEQSSEYLMIPDYSVYKPEVVEDFIPF